jgi:hypothetical protein
MVSFPQASPPKPCAHLSPPPYATHRAVKASVISYTHIRAQIVTQYSNVRASGVCASFWFQIFNRIIKDFCSCYIFTECTSSQMALKLLMSWNLRYFGIFRSYSGKSLPMFRNYLSVTFSRVNKSTEKFSSWNFWSLNMRPLSFPETSVSNCHYTTRNNPEERRSHIGPVGSLRKGVLTAFSIVWSYESLPFPTVSVTMIRTSNFSPELELPFALLCHSEMVIWTAEERRLLSCYALPIGNFRCFDPL